MASCLEVEGHGSRDQGEPKWEDVRIWDNVKIYPESFQADFCVLPSDESRKSPILESLAAEVIESVEGLANEEVLIARSSGQLHARIFVIPIIVTNATLVVCRFAPDKIRINDGTLDPSDTEIEEVPFIRFRKSIVTDFPNERFYNLKEANRARERTVFVVNANHIDSFLTNWNIEPIGLFGFATQRVMRERRAFSY